MALQTRPEIPGGRKKEVPVTQLRKKMNCDSRSLSIPKVIPCVGVSYKRSASFFASGLIASTPQGHMEYMIRTSLSPLRTIIMEPAASNA